MKNKTTQRTYTKAEVDSIVEKAIEAERARVAVVPSDEDRHMFVTKAMSKFIKSVAKNPLTGEITLKLKDSPTLEIYNAVLESLQSQRTISEDVLRGVIDSWDKYLLSRRVVDKELDWDMFESAEKSLKALREAMGEL